MASLKKVVTKFAQGLEYVSLVLITFATAITVVNVLIRSILHMPIFGVTEMVQYSTLAAVSLGAAYVTLTNGHAKVELLVDALPRTAKNVTSLITNIMNAAFFGVFFWKLWPMMVDQFNSHRTTESLLIPYWYINAFIEVCLFAVFVVEIFLCAEHVYLLCKKDGGSVDAIEDKEAK